MPEQVIAVDIGNSWVHAGLVDTRRSVCRFRSNFPLAEMSRRLPAFLDKIKIDTPAVIGGGRSGPAMVVGKILAVKKLSPAVHLYWHSRLPVRFNYKNSSTLGADRIADALYAAAKYPKQNVIIIDSGTAITVDAVNASGNFSGGVIMAGAVTHLRSLHAATDTLPLITMRDNKIPFPGNSTASCMQAGAVHGTTGALNHLVRKYKKLLGGKCAVLATGGAWHLTSTLVDFECIEAPDMTLIGMGLYACHLRSSASPR
jgi:type III pantothenate kinase